MALCSALIVVNAVVSSTAIVCGINVVRERPIVARKAWYGDATDHRHEYRQDHDQFQRIHGTYSSDLWSPLRIVSLERSQRMFRAAASENTQTELMAISRRAESAKIIAHY